MTTSEQYWFKRGYNNALAAMNKRVEEAFDALCKENRRGRASFFTQGNPELSKALKRIVAALTILRVEKERDWEESK